MPPAAFAAMLNHFYGVATKVLIAHDAIVDKLIGDEVMGLFIPGLCGADYRTAAVRAAEGLILAMEDPSGRAWLPVGAAVHAGVAFVGKVGSGGVSDFTALGDTVNTAARLQAEAADGEIVLSEPVYDAVRQWHPDLPLRQLTIRGREQPLAVRVLRPTSR